MRGGSIARSSASGCSSSSRSPWPRMRLAPASPEAPLLPLEDESQPRSRRRAGLSRFTLAAAGLALAAVVTRLPFVTHTLYAFDSANYALAVRDFYNVAFHQPHPPGYPLYVLFARAIDLVVQDANRSLIFEGIAWSAIAVACTIALGRAMFGRGVGLLAGL